MYDMPPPIDEGKGEAPMEEEHSGGSGQGVDDSGFSKSPGNEFEDELLRLTDEEAEWLALLGPDLFWQAWTRRVPKEFRTRMEDGKYLPGRISPPDVVE